VKGVVRGFVVSTTCSTVDEFVAKYHSRADDDTIFVSVVDERVLGTECAFAMLLADRQPVLAGICTVIELYRDDENPYGRRGMRLAIRRLGITSEHVFAAMAEARAAAGKRRFPRGSTAPPDDDGIPIEIDDGMNEPIPPALADDPSAPTLIRG
jgi:hypothetical protein